MPEFNFLYHNKSDFVKSPNDFGANGSTLILIEDSNNKCSIRFFINKNR